MQKLTTKARRFMTVLLSATTTQEAIKTAGISQTTAYKYLRDPLFKTELRKMRRAVMMHATAKLSETAEQAVDVLAEVMADADAPSNARVSAARAVLEMNYNAIQADDIMERIEQLESAGSG